MEDQVIELIDELSRDLSNIEYIESLKNIQSEITSRLEANDCDLNYD